MSYHGSSCRAACYFIWYSKVAYFGGIPVCVHYVYSCNTNSVRLLTLLQHYSRHRVLLCYWTLLIVVVKHVKICDTYLLLSKAPRLCAYFFSLFFSARWMHTKRCSFWPYTAVVVFWYTRRCVGSGRNRWNSLRFVSYT